VPDKEYNKRVNFPDSMYGERELKEKFIRDQARANLASKPKVTREQMLYSQQAQLAERRQQAAMQGINRGIRGGGLNPFQRTWAINNLQKRATQGNKAIGSVPRAQQIAQDLPAQMFSGDKVLNKLESAFNHDKSEAELNYQAHMNKLNEEKQMQQQSRNAAQFIRNSVWGRR
jgi:hypothetical protein